MRLPLRLWFPFSLAVLSPLTSWKLSCQLLLGDSAGTCDLGVPFLDLQDDRPAVSSLKTTIVLLLGPCCYLGLRAMLPLSLALDDRGHCLALPDLGRSSTRSFTEGPPVAISTGGQGICPAQFCSVWGGVAVILIPFFFLLGLKRTSLAGQRRAKRQAWHTEGLLVSSSLPLPHLESTGPTWAWITVTLNRRTTGAGFQAPLSSTDVCSLERIKCC